MTLETIQIVAAHAVLDGDLDTFMAAALAARVGATHSEASAQAQ